MDSISDLHADPLELRLSMPGTYMPPENWPDYRTEFGLGPEHVDALIRLACDPALHGADPGSDAIWAPVHAWRALGQLRAAEAVAPLLDLLLTMEEDEAVDLEIPFVLGMIGPPALPILADFVADRSAPTMPVVTAMTALEKIATGHPKSRGRCVDILRGILERRPAQPSVNGFAIASLLDLHAVEAIDSIRDAYQTDGVDISIPGDEEDAEIALGLRLHRTTPRPFYNHLAETAPLPAPVRSHKIGRNEPCPCGSGRKYKKCCLH